MEYPINEKRLPIDQLEKLGLYEQGTLYLERSNVDALLSGRRTDMINMANLQLEGLSIRQLDAKLSLRENSDGTLSLNLHPVYRQVAEHPLLSRQEMDSLIKGERSAISKDSQITEKRHKELIIEYDEQTREFVAFAPRQVQAPSTVNGQRLSKEQLEDFRRGNVVELDDGTRLQHTATDSRGVRSSSSRLIMTLENAGTVSTAVFRDLSNIKGSMQQQSQGFSKGYNSALTQMLAAERPGAGELSVQEYAQQQQHYANLKTPQGRKLGL